MPIIMTTIQQERVAAIQRTMREQGTIDGWLFYDFRRSDPLSYRVLLLDPAMHVTRRWYYWIPSEGTPRKLLHRIEPHVLDRLPGETDLYVSWEQQRQLLAGLLNGSRRIAMQYSPLNAVPYVSRVDAGTIELVRSCGVEVVSSADLIQTFEAVWTDRQLESHQYAAAALRRIVDEAFGQVRDAVTKALEDAGIIKGYQAVLDPKKVGKDVTAFVGVSVSHQKYIDAFAALVARQPDVLECHHVTGRHTLMLKVRTTNTESLAALHLPIALFMLVLLFPFYWMTIVSLKPSSLRSKMKLFAALNARFFVLLLDANGPSRNPLPTRPCSITIE